MNTTGDDISLIMLTGGAVAALAYLWLSLRYRKVASILYTIWRDERPILYWILIAFHATAVALFVWIAVSMALER